MSEFKAGDTAFLIDGEAVYIRDVTSTGFVVSKIYETSGSFDEPPGQEIETAVHLVSKLYTEPSTLKMHASIVWMEQDRDKLAGQIKKKHDELEQIQQQINAHQAAMKRVGIFQSVIDFLDGKITHVAQKSGYHGEWQVKTIQDFMARKEDDYAQSTRYTFRMMSISYGMRDGREYNKDKIDPWDLRLNISDYRDGSGTENAGFILCQSYEEAKDIAVREMMAYGKKHWGGYKTAPSVTKALLAIGANVPPEWTQNLRDQQVASAQKDFEKALKELQAAEAYLQKILAGEEFDKPVDWP